MKAGTYCQIELIKVGVVERFTESNKELSLIHGSEQIKSINQFNQYA